MKHNQLKIILLLAVTGFSLGANLNSHSTFAINSVKAMTNNQEAISFYNSLPPKVRIGLQRALTWNGDYVGISDGNITPRTINSIRSFQSSLNHSPTGLLDQHQLKILLQRANNQEQDMGYRQHDDRSTGISIGLPYKFIHTSHPYKRGTRFVSRNEDLDIVTMVLPLAEKSLEEFYQSHLTKAGRKVDYHVFRGDWFVVNGFENGKHFYIRAHRHSTGYSGEIRGYAISYHASYAQHLSRLMTIMSSDFKADLSSLSVAESRIDWSTMAHQWKPNAPVEPARNPAVVAIAPPAIGGVSQPPKSETSSGTGFFITETGHLITNAHVVNECKEISISPLGKASLIDADKTNDIALLKLQTGVSTSPLQLAKTPTRLGDDIIALGFPLQSLLQNGLNLTMGNISSLAGIGGDSRFVQISAAVQPGNSGGPLLNRDGKVVGIITGKLNAMRVASNTGDIPQNISFALRSEILEVYMRRHSIDFTLGEANDDKKSVADLVDKVKTSIYTVLCAK